MNNIRLLVTGAEGFVGRHFVKAVREGVLGPVKLGCTVRTVPTEGPSRRCLALDITDAAAVDRVVGDFAPTHVLHLAGMAAPSEVGVEDRQIWDVNLYGALNVAHAIRRQGRGAHMIFAGSGLVYGDTAKTVRPLDETATLAPNNLYAVTKAAADLALGVLAREGLNVLRLRLFNHTGPGQSDAFVVPAFARQIARAEAGLQDPIIHVGDLSAERDFLDVSSAVDAYILAVQRCGDLPRGQIINIASGTPRRIGDVLDGLLALSSIKLEVRLDKDRLRPSDTPHYVGDRRLAEKLLDWCPGKPFEQTLKDVLDHWRQRVRLEATQTVSR